MKKEIQMNWLEDMAFESVLEGHRLVLDADESVGGKNLGPPPKDLLLVSLAGCTAMDVISILKKMREPVSWFNLKVSSDTADEHPKKFISFNVVYQFKKSDGINPQMSRKPSSFPRTSTVGSALR